MTDNNQPHSPPKYVEGHYKPHFGDPDADYVIFIWPLDPARSPHLATTDNDGDASGVVRYDGDPLYEGGATLVGTIYDEEISLRDHWQDRIEESDVRCLLDDD